MTETVPYNVPVRGRFAPFPSGHMYLGNIFSFLMAWLGAKSCQGEITLHIEDIDTARCHAEYATKIMSDLEWLGLTWDVPVFFQHDRLEAYEEAFQTLKHEIVHIPVFALSRTSTLLQHLTGGHYINPGTCRNLTAQQILDRHVFKQFAYRHICEGPCVFTDRIRLHIHSIYKPSVVSAALLNEPMEDLPIS